MFAVRLYKVSLHAKCSFTDTDRPLCTCNQVEEHKNTQGDHSIIDKEPELCNERAIAKSSISNPLLSQGEVLGAIEVYLYCV